jgi:hypothetical protein
MPFRARVFQENVERRLQGSARDDLARACEAYASLTTPQQRARSIRGMMDVLDREWMRTRDGRSWKRAVAGASAPVP